VGDHDDGLAAPVQVAQQLDDLRAPWESRAPVGSSASSRVGSLARARAMASRCRWPPDSTTGTLISERRRPRTERRSGWGLAACGLAPPPARAPQGPSVRYPSPPVIHICPDHADRGKTSYLTDWMTSMH
jgi:hypothetical protein